MSFYVPPHERPGNNTQRASISEGQSSNYRRDNFSKYGQRNTGGYSGNFYGGDRGGGNYRYGGQQTARRNKLGFHGDMHDDKAAEKRLFGDVSEAGINFANYEKIPVETSGVDVPPAIESFADADVAQSLRDNVERCHYVTPTPVQKYSIPIGLAGRDMMACAQTGSGKTGGFLFPTISCLLKSGPMKPADTGKSSRSDPSAVFLAPTRELACQIYDEAQKFCYKTGLAPVVVYGGSEPRLQIREILRGCDLLVATPGRLLDFIDRGHIGLTGILSLTLDEADRMLDMGFEQQIRRIVMEMGMPRDRQTFMFSATFPVEIQRLASEFLRDYIFLTVGV